MLDLVLWFFVLALTPVALDLTWRLLSALCNWLGLCSARAFVADDRWGPVHPGR